MTVSIDCWTDLLNRVRQVPGLEEKTVSVNSEEDLVAILKGAKFPMAGVVYGGIAANSGDPSRQGLACDITCTVLLIVANNAIGGLDQKPFAATLLQAIYDQIKMATSPSMHKWKFVAERPVGVIGNSVIWRQQWSTAYIRT